MELQNRRMITDLARLVLSETAALQVTLPPEYFYKSLPLALIDAVYSIGVTYSSTRNTVERFCQNQRPPWLLYRWEEGPEHTIRDFLAATDARSPQELASSIYGNRQRTSSRNGILKAEAVSRCARVLRGHGVDSFADWRRLQSDAAIERDFRAVPGQGSGVAFGYFKMLCGDDAGIKLDRHIHAFMNRHGIGGIAELKQVAAELEITPRKLDYAIWQKMSRPAA